MAAGLVDWPTARLTHMRINSFLALGSRLSRRQADIAIADGRVTVNGRVAIVGQQIQPSDVVALDSRPITPAVKTITIILNKPVGYVCSRNGQGSKTVYDLLPDNLHHLKPVGRLDKDSSGLLLMTNDGQLAHQLTHPSFAKEKVYEVKLDKELSKADASTIERGVQLEDGISQLRLKNTSDRTYEIRMSEGRNRQIRRTFAALGYQVKALHRSQLGDYRLESLGSRRYRPL